MLAFWGKHATRGVVHMLAFWGKHATLVLMLVLLTAPAGCKSSRRRDWRPDSMRSSDEWTKMALESERPNDRRRGVVGLSESRDARADWAMKLYETVAKSDIDASVRCAAFRAMEQIADPRSQTTAIAVLESRRQPSEEIVPAPASVRWGAVRTLYAIASASGGANDAPPAVVTGLIETVRSEPEQRVRLTAIDTLAYYRDRKVPPALVDALEDEDFAVRRAAESSLVALTGVTHHYDPMAWRAWLAKTSDPFASAGQTPEGWNEPDEKPKWDWLQLPGSG